MNELFLAGMLVAPVTTVDKYNFGFQNREQVYKVWQQAEWYCQYLDNHKGCYHMMHKDKEWCELRANAEWCRKVWYYMDDAFFYSNIGDTNERYRMLELQAMVRIRDMIGCDNYVAGRLPHPWPVWLFRNYD